MYFIAAIENLGKLPDKVFITTARIGIYIIILSAFFFGYVVNSSNSKSYSLSYIFQPPYLTTSQVLGTETKAVPYIVKEIPFPNVSAKAIIAVDVINNKILYEKDMNAPFPPASTTKLMTAIVALEHYNVDEDLEVSESCTQVDSTRVGLVPGEKVKVTDLVHSLLISSSGDSACVLASTLYTSTEFIELMNQKAFDYGLTNTNFTNAIGLDSIDNSHISTAYDLYLLAKKASENNVVKEIVALKSYEFTSGAYPRTVSNTNQLLWSIPGSVGIKTGKTTGAGEVLIYRFNDDFHDIVIVVMNSLDRFGDTQQVLNWLFTTYSWEV